MRTVIAKLGDLKLRRPHQGLYFDTRCGDLTLGNDDVKRDLVTETAGLKGPDGYEAFVRRWQAALAAAGDTRVARAATDPKGGRLVIGLGGKGVVEAGMTFHHTYGVPCLPGSALKGLARAFARKRLRPEDWGPTSVAYRILFGDQEEAGFVTFHDALPEKYQLHQDVMTVHHREYYQQESGPPADWDDPTPVPFLSASGTFLVAISGPEGWRDVAFQILGLALEREGIGGKTSSGYGRLKLAYAEAGVGVPALDFPVEDQAPRPQGFVPSQKRAAAAPAAKPAATTPQPGGGAPAPTPTKPAPGGTAEEFLKEVRGLRPGDRRDAQALQKFIRGGLERFNRLPEAERRKAAKALLDQLGGKQGEYANLPLFKEMKKALGK